MGVGAGRYVKELAISERPAGVVYAVMTEALEVSLEVPSDKRPTRARPAPDLVWRWTTGATSSGFVDNLNLVRVPNPAWWARS